VSFDVRLEGSGADWVSAGGGGSTAFNRLKEGRYILHVRPRSAGETGDETTLSFTIRPPWFRTNIAYLTYGLLAFGFIFVAGRVSSFLERRENSRLERLVAQRTRELNASNNQLAGQVEENRMLSQAVEQSPVAVFITTLDGAIAFANSRAYALTGLSPEEVIGQRLYRLQGAGMPAAMVEEITSTLARGGSWHGQLGHQHKDGHLVHVRTTISPMRGPDGKLRYYLVLKEDISASLAEQDRRRRLEAQLFQAQKLESIGTLAGGIAHDFNNILTAILGFCELARLEAAPGEAIQKDLDEIRTAGMRAKELVAQILTFSRQGTAKLVPLDLAQAVTDALRLVRASTPATVEFVTSLEGGTVRADSTQVQQIVLNLCTNSVHAMNGRSGRITLSVKSVRVSEALAAEIPDLTVGEFMLLAVSDNGTGMDQATLDRVFDPFFTTKKQGEGTGLGLAIVQGIVASHRGALRVKSTVGEGTTFEIYFPETRENCITLEPDQPAPRGNGEEILVVDDEPVVADFVASRLKQLGYRPLPFRDPLAALAAVSEAPTRFHAIITDLTMPQLTGADLVRKIRAFGLSMPAVVVTGYSPDATRTELSALSRCVVVQKPFSGDEVALALAQVLQTRAEESTGAVSRGS
jgi:PAS domain S-box-containing protein